LFYSAIPDKSQYIVSIQATTAHFRVVNRAYIHNIEISLYLCILLLLNDI
jgi:hypothetical protein